MLNTPVEPEYAIPESVLKTILGYLGTRPYTEVAQGIQVLQSLRKISSGLDNKDVKLNVQE
jgi:hypothetical protein